MKPSSPDRCPSWKIHTSAPTDAVSDSTFITIALSGSSTEPNARNSSTKVTRPTKAAIHGRMRPRLPSRSTSWAVSPPTSTWDPAGGTTARTSVTSCLARGEIGSAW